MHTGILKIQPTLKHISDAPTIKATNQGSLLYCRDMAKPTIYHLGVFQKTAFCV